MNSDDETQSGKLQFHVDASILIQLGEQLVTRRSVALAELIKNAFDADATEVIVALENVRKPNGAITVSDNGQGMTLHEIQSNWMRLATNNKKENTFSTKFQRPRTGQKGIGRFAVRRLAHRLILVSVALHDGKKVRTSVSFNWTLEFQPGNTLTDIPIEYITEVVSPSTATGVTLHLLDVKEAWTDDDVAELRRDLASLASPFPSTEIENNDDNNENSDPGFRFLLVAPEFPSAEGELSEGLLEAAWGIIKAQVVDGKPIYKLTIRQSGELVVLSPSNENFRELNGIGFTIHYFVYSAAHFDDSFMSVRDAQRLGRDMGGVRVYLDRFRVFPYGDTLHGDDWLELDRSRARRTVGLVNSIDLIDMQRKLGADRPELLTPGNNQLFGVVHISQENHPQFAITTSREGFLENDAFKELRRFVQIGLWWMTLQYARVTYQAREQRREERKAPRQAAISELIRDIKTELAEKQSIPAQPRIELVASLNTLEQEAQMREEEQIDDLTLTRILSATGTVVMMMNHQLRSMLGGLHSVSVDFKELRPSLESEVLDQFDKTLYRLDLWRNQVEQQVSQLGFLLGEKNRKERTRPLVRELANAVVEPLSSYLDDSGIEFINDVTENVRTPPIFEAEIYAVLLHVFTNAVKAVRDAQVRKIMVKAERLDNEVVIYMLDTGRGIPFQDREKVFRPFTSTTASPDPLFGTGTGIGLKTVRDLLSNYNASARFIDAEQPWNTCLEIKLRI